MSLFVFSAESSREKKQSEFSMLSNVCMCAVPSVYSTGAVEAKQSHVSSFYCVPHCFTPHVLRLLSHIIVKESPQPLLCWCCAVINGTHDYQPSCTDYM